MVQYYYFTRTEAKACVVACGVLWRLLVVSLEAVLNNNTAEPSSLLALFLLTARSATSLFVADKRQAEQE